MDIDGQPEQGEAVTAVFHRALYHKISHTGALSGCAAGLCILLTGAAGRIGRALAVAFASAGATRLLLLDLSLAGLQTTVAAVHAASSSCTASAHALDISTGAESEVQDILQSAGCAVDVLIANAGMLKNELLADSDPLAWWRTQEVNVRGTYSCVRACLPGMLQHKRGTIICMSSMQATVMRRSESAYGISKLAVARLVDFLHAEYAQEGIRAFSMHPGNVTSELALGTPPDTHYLLVDPPELAAGVCLYLTTPQADFLRGRFVRANWDLAELEQRSVEIVEQDLFKMKLVC